MKKIIAMALGLGVSLSAVTQTADAGGGINIDSCDFSSDVEIHLKSDGVLLYQSGNSWFLNRGKLDLDGEPISLTRSQRRDLQKFQQEVEAFVPEVSEVVTSAVSLALLAVTTSFDLLTGDEIETTSALTQKMDRFESELNARWNDTTFGASWSDDEWLSEQVEELVTDVAAELAAASVKLAFHAMLNPDAVEARQVGVEARVEELVEERAEKLERKAEALCERLERMDALESKIKVFNVIELSQS